ncbi:predicted protein [Uncinocarpus reesii 1704]|uniref:Elongator complex protein 5 n=1 Tax=Uncinocarpus reesii (strain UAMH 1704) TaxID=336963 RepID=C4JR53_UNCRE|nr:uncharacterized protein UREG_03535 [Uncinocarpus reesii 1704]EEP78689.1 predicted protein [Uncinocarpus reesii 1704]
MKSVDRCCNENLCLFTNNSDPLKQPAGGYGAHKGPRAQFFTKAPFESMIVGDLGVEIIYPVSDSQYFNHWFIDYKMAPGSNISRRRAHNLLLLSSLLNLRDTTSPLTLVLDSLEQPATPLLKEYIRRAKLSKSHITFVSFETFARPEGVDSFISAIRKNPNDVAKEVVSSFPPCANKLHISLIVVYHQDIPVSGTSRPYTPTLHSLLTYLATTIFTVHSLPHVLARKAAADKSMVTPVFGLDEEREGIILGRQDSGKNLGNHDGIVLEMEHRRKSGRGIAEWYFLPFPAFYARGSAREVASLLDDHPLYKREEELGPGETEEEPVSTFELGLTERQRRDRENVVLPYFDAQKGEGPGEGGRILYEMGEEDDFDEEEDEI